MNIAPAPGTCASQSGSICSAAARPTARPRCAICSAARAPISPRWRASGCRCRRASRSPRKSARPTTRRAQAARRPRGPGRGGARPQVGRTVGATIRRCANPLLVSVRSGARASMPGMMDTILNLGLNDDTVNGLAERSGDARFAYDSYRRFIQMYSDVVLGIDHGVFEDILENHKSLNGYILDTDLTAEDWLDVIGEYKAAVETRDRQAVPAGHRASSCGAPSAPCSAPGRTRAPSPTAACTPFPTTGVRPSTCRPWCSATWARRRPPASPSRAILPPARASSTASSSSMRRARTWWPASARPSRSPRPRARRRAKPRPRSRR